MLQSKIRRGELDREITFIQEVIDETVKGEDYRDNWTEIDIDPVVFSRKKELPGNEMMVDNQVKFYQRTVFTVDYREDISVTMRVVCNDKVYEILSITENDMGRGTYLDVVTNYLPTETYQFVQSTNVVVVFCNTPIDLSGGFFPTIGGTGASGGIKAGNVFRVSVAGSPGGTMIPVNAEIMAKVDVPGQTLSNWWVRIV